MKKDGTPNPTGKMNKMFYDLDYAVFGVFGAKLESDKLNVAIGGKSDEEQKGQGLKIMTPKQMILKLAILLVQLKARNNSEKLKNEIRKILYSLYRSKHLTKVIYNHLTKTI